MTKISIQKITQALLCTERNVRDREGRSFPKPCREYPREYWLIDVLWFVNGQERTSLCNIMGIDPSQLRDAMMSQTDPDSLHIDFPDDLPIGV